jgi:MoaA/NifB/PqqE/SkfB family radical SAM enzyme
VTPSTTADANVDVVEALLRRAALPRTVEIETPHCDGRPRVDVPVTLAGVGTTLRFHNRDPERRAFGRTPSFDLEHLGDSLPPKAGRVLEEVVRQLARVDAGGLELATAPEEGGPSPAEVEAEPEPEGAGPIWIPGEPRRGLPVLQEASQGWTRSIFERRFEALATERERVTSVVIVIHQACQMACQFCPPSDREVKVFDSPDEQFDDLVYQARRGRELNARTIELGGNDVLRFPRIVELVERVAALGYTRIIAQSPGQALEDPAIAEPLSRVPGLEVAMPIYGRNAEEHDWITRTPGTFEGLCRVIDRARALGGPRVTLQTIALSGSVENLMELAAFTRERFGIELHVNPLRSNRLDRDDHLRHTATIEELRDTLERMPEAFSEEFPLCAFPVERVRTVVRQPRSESMPINFFDLGLAVGSDDARASEQRLRTHVDGCRDCAAREACPGLLGSYRFHVGDDVRPWSESELHGGATRPSGSSSSS